MSSKNFKRKSTAPVKEAIENIEEENASSDEVITFFLGYVFIIPCVFFKCCRKIYGMN